MRSSLLVCIAVSFTLGCGGGGDPAAKASATRPGGERPSVELVLTPGTERPSLPPGKSTTPTPDKDGFVFEGGNGSVRRLRHDHVTQVYALKDRKHFLTIGESAKLWDLASLTPKTLKTGSRIGSGVITDSPTHGRIALGMRIPGGTVAVWDTKDGRLLREFKYSDGTPMHLAFTENGKRLLCFMDEVKSPKNFTQYKGTVISWDILEGGVGVQQEFIAFPAAIDGYEQKLVFFDGAKLIALDVSTPVTGQKSIARLGNLLNKGKNPAYAYMEFSPDLRTRVVYGRMVSPAGNYESFEVWEPPSGKRIGTFKDPRSISMSRAIGIDMILMAGSGWIDVRSPSGERLAQAPELFRATGGPRMKLELPVVTVDSLGLGHPVVAALDNGEVWVWEPGLDEFGRKRP